MSLDCINYKQNNQMTINRQNFCSMIHKLGFEYLWYIKDKNLAIVKSKQLIRSHNKYRVGIALVEISNCMILDQYNTKQQNLPLNLCIQLSTTLSETLQIQTQSSKKIPQNSKQEASQWQNKEQHKQQILQQKPEQINVSNNIILQITQKEQQVTLINTEISEESEQKKEIQQQIKPQSVYDINISNNNDNNNNFERQQESNKFQMTLFQDQETFKPPQKDNKKRLKKKILLFKNKHKTKLNRTSFYASSTQPIMQFYRQNTQKQNIKKNIDQNLEIQMQENINKFALLWFDPNMALNRNTLQRFQNMYVWLEEVDLFPQFTLQIALSIQRNKNTQYIIICSNTTFRQIFNNITYTLPNLKRFYLFCASTHIAEKNRQLYSGYADQERIKITSCSSQLYCLIRNYLSKRRKQLYF